jgi:hypothetical protein
MIRSVPRLVSRLLMLSVLAVSGVYLIVYLYRWECNRDLISGLFLLAAEIAYVGSSLRGELRDLVDRVDALESPPGRRPRPPAVAPTARPARHVDWLREAASGQTNVFVPILLGAGVLLSAVAYVVERVAGVAARSPAARPPVGRLAGLRPPPGGLLGPAPPPGASAGAVASRRVRGRGVRIVAIVVAALTLGAGIDLIADATQSRPSARTPDASTAIELRVDQRRPRPAVEAAEALAVACRGTLHADSEVAAITSLGGDRVRLEVTPALSELRPRRVFGCLQDATLDLVQASVVAWADVPAGAAPRADGTGRDGAA